jgi:hypothetical protein
MDIRAFLIALALVVLLGLLMGWFAKGVAPPAFAFCGSMKQDPLPPWGCP